MNKKLKLAVIDVCGCQIIAAQLLGMSESRLSRLVQGHAVPTPEELQKFTEVFGEKRTAEIFGTQETPEAA